MNKGLTSANSSSSEVTLKSCVRLELIPNIEMLAFNFVTYFQSIAIMKNKWKSNNLGIVENVPSIRTCIQNKSV
jgi:hypothetical protein